MQTYLVTVYDRDDVFSARDLTYIAIVESENSSTAKTMIEEYYKEHYKSYPEDVVVRKISKSAVEPILFEAFL